jgi:hypothetical protein
MATLDFPRFEEYLGSFKFGLLFTQVLGWNTPPTEAHWRSDEAGGAAFAYRNVAELGGVVAVQVVTTDGWPDEALRMRIWKHVVHRYAENLIIFTDQQEKASKSQWYWVKRSKDPETGKVKLTARRHDYFRGQPVDLFASKLQAMVVELSELDESGRMPVLEAARRIQAALDVEKTTKKFYEAYKAQHLSLLEDIHGIDNERDKRWYASVLLNRLMFVWFMQKKLFLDDGNADYLRVKLQESQARGPERFFGEFLNALFFEAFAKPAADRSETAKTLTGKVPYLNGGLFLHHKLEQDEPHKPRIGKSLKVADRAFEGIFNLFASFTWHLDDTPGGDADEINPDVLGYIFEKYINQKAFGAYYTRPEITGYLAERSIHQLVLERIYQPALPELGLKEIKFDSVADLLARMDARTALRLANEVLPSITVLDPAAGSGAFLVAALKCLINIYSAIVGRAELGASTELQTWLKKIQRDHPSVGYWIKRRIVTDNLYGVDIMEEACEIAKLRLFLAMVASVRKVEHLEPLPNIDFNIVPGNSLVGLIRVDEHEFDVRHKGVDMFRKSFRELLEEKHRNLASYRNATEVLGKDIDLQNLRDNLEIAMGEANGVMDELVQARFDDQGIKFEQATWDPTKGDLGKPKKRQVTLADVAELRPLHWGYVFDEIVQSRGGFDVVLTNPPWEVLKPQDKEFFADHSELVSTNKMDIKQFEKERSRLLKTKEVRDAWLAYESRFPHLSAYFRSAPDYVFQSAVIGGKRTGTDINLYKLFVERCFALLRNGGHCGIVVPSSLYKDLGASGLRTMLFDNCRIDSLISLSNEKFIFEEVHHSFGLLFLSFEKGGTTTKLNSTFRINPREAVKAEDFASFVHDPGNFVELDVALIDAMNPETRAVMEFRSEVDVAVVKKMLRFPPIGKKLPNTWTLQLAREFDMTIDSKVFETSFAPGRLPLYEGKAIHQLTSDPTKIRYWVDEDVGRARLLGREADVGQEMPYQRYRFAYRSIGRTTDSRTLIGTILPARSFYGHSMNAAKEPRDPKIQLYIVALLNSLVFDYFLRLSVGSNLTMFYIYQSPAPRISEDDPRLMPIALRAARLVCSTEAFIELASSVGIEERVPILLGDTERQRIRAEIDGLVANLYEFDEQEFRHILGGFPLVPEPVKVASLNALRDARKGLLK